MEPNQTSTPVLTLMPATEKEVVDAVRSAIQNNLEVRVVGAGHSFSPLVTTTGLLIDLGRLSGITGIDSDRNRVRMHAGTPISALGESLWKQGLALSNQGDIDKQTIAGAIATATHGSGLELGSFSSSLRWVKLVDGRGEIREIAETDIRELKAAQVALGSLGVFLEVELEVSPRYHLAEEITYPKWQETLDGWDVNVRSNRHYSFMWLPDADSAALYELDVPSGESMANRSYTKRYNAVDLYEPEGISLVANHRRDRAYRIYPGTFGLPFHELEYFVPVAQGRDAVTAIQHLMLDRHPDQKYPLEVRWVRGEDAYLSPFFNRDTTSLSVSGEPGTNYLPYLRDFDSVLQDFQARAHWGKIHFLTRDRITDLYPEYEAFLQVRREFDPDNVYLNEHARELVG